MTAITHARWGDPVIVKRVHTVPEVVNTADDRDFAQRFERLTAYRQRIIRLRCEGLTISEVAHRVFRQPQAVKNTLTLIYQALGVAGHGQMPRIAYLLGRMDRGREQG